MSCIYDIWLSQCEAVGNVRAKLFVDYFGTAEILYNADINELKQIDGIGNAAVCDLQNKDLTKSKKILEFCDKSGVEVLTISDAGYPERLRNIYDPPTVLYIKGTLPPVDDVPVIGIVGTRECTPYGYKNAENLGYHLSENGFVVSTGLARGIDTAAAIGALRANMPVIGVVGCGADMVYPLSNKKLFSKVLENGAVVSEYMPGTQARPEYFPARNRIISGLSCGVAVIEAPERSGALITAQRALEQCRDVFALPGNVDSPACLGSNKLLREGAIPFLTPDDVIDEYRDLFTIRNKSIDKNKTLDYIDVDAFTGKLSQDAIIILKTIGRDSLFSDEIIDISNLTAQTVMTALTELEVSGFVKRNISGKWETLV